MLRRAIPGDEAALDEFLVPYSETSMFLRSNLAAHGLSPSEDGHATTYHMWIEHDEIRAVFGITNDGFMMIQSPEPNAEACAAWAKELSGRRMVGVTGHADQVPRLLNALGLEQAEWALDKTEPMYVLDLERLQSPKPAGTLRAVTEDDAPMLRDWFHQYEHDTGLAKEITDATRERVKNVVAYALTSDRVRILEINGDCVATTAFNAQLPDVVQVGGVFVRRDKRNCGFGRRVVAAHLQEARANGVTRAFLFANNPAAARAYEAIGFERIGSYRINILKTPRDL